jgi:hypothetical protein
MLDHLILGLTAVLHLKQFLFRRRTVIGLYASCRSAVGHDGDLIRSFSMDPLALLMQRPFVGASAIDHVHLLNIPGGHRPPLPPDGYPMAQQGGKVAIDCRRALRRRRHRRGDDPMFAPGPGGVRGVAFSPAEYSRSHLAHRRLGGRAQLDRQGMAMGALTAMSPIGIDRSSA